MKVQRRAGESSGKYAVVKLRELATNEQREAMQTLISGGFVSFENIGDVDEFFVVRLRDRYAQAALAAYAAAAEIDDPEYAAEVRQLMLRAGPSHPNVKRPD